MPLRLLDRDEKEILDIVYRKTIYPVCDKKKPVIGNQKRKARIHLLTCESCQKKVNDYAQNYL